MPADTAAAAAARPAGARGHRAQGGLGRSRDRSLSDKDPGRGAGCGGRGLSSESIWRECPCTSKTSLMAVDPSHCLSSPTRAPPPPPDNLKSASSWTPHPTHQTFCKALQDLAGSGLQGGPSEPSTWTLRLGRARGPWLGAAGRGVPRPRMIGIHGAQGSAVPPSDAQ